MFDDVVVYVDYFVWFGVSYLYLLLVLMVELGLLYGYDIVDYGMFGVVFGGEVGFMWFVDVLCVCGFGVIVDIVLNYMGVGGLLNGWWNDVFEWGLVSLYVCYFDIDWYLFDFVFDGKVLLLCFGVLYGDVFVVGDIMLCVDLVVGCFYIVCFGWWLLVVVVIYVEILCIVNCVDLNVLVECFDVVLVCDSVWFVVVYVVLCDYVVVYGLYVFDVVLCGVDFCCVCLCVCLYWLFEC